MGPDRSALRALLEQNRKTVLSVAVTAMLVASLVAAAVPSAAVETTLNGPEEVERNERIQTTATVDLADGERIPVEAFVLTLRPADSGESLTVRFAPNGTVLGVSPERGTIANGDIRIQQLVERLTITPVRQGAPYGYGDRFGYDDGERREFGYGYGYGYGYGDDAPPEFVYDVSFPATAFDRGDFVGHLSVDTGEDTSFESDEFRFEVTKPNDDAPGRDDENRDGGGDDADDGESDDPDGGEDSDGADDGAESPEAGNGNGNGGSGNGPPEEPRGPPANSFAGMLAERLVAFFEAVRSLFDLATSAPAAVSGGSHA